jgi:hypothetical protein
MGLLEVAKGRGFGSQKRLSQFLSNPNQTTINKNVKKAEISRDTHHHFLLTRRITCTSSQECASKRASIQGDHCSSKSRIDQKLSL